MAVPDSKLIYPGEIENEDESAESPNDNESSCLDEVNATPSADGLNQLATMRGATPAAGQDASAQAATKKPAPESQNTSQTGTAGQGKPQSASADKKVAGAGQDSLKSTPATKDVTQTPPVTKAAATGDVPQVLSGQRNITDMGTGVPQTGPDGAAIVVDKTKSTDSSPLRSPEQEKRANKLVETLNKILPLFYGKAASDMIIAAMKKGANSSDPAENSMPSMLDPDAQKFYKNCVEYLTGVEPAYFGPPDQDQRSTRFSELFRKVLPLAHGHEGSAKIIAAIEDGELTPKEGNMWQPRFFGPVSQKFYADCVQFTNLAVTANARALIERGLPLTGCPICVPIDDRTGKPISDLEYRAKIKNGELSLNLSNLSDEEIKDSNKTIQHIDRLDKAIDWVNGHCATELKQANLKSVVEAYKQRIEHTNAKTAGKGDMAGWLPKGDMNDPAAMQKWLAEVDPWLTDAEQAKVYRKAIDSLDRASKAGSKWYISKWGNKSFSEVINLADFPGEIVRDKAGNVADVVLTLPKDLARTQENIAQMQRIKDWKDSVKDAVQQAVNEFALDRAKNERVCVWNDESKEGYTEDGKQYNSIRHRFNTENVTVETTDRNGIVRKEQLIKVTTTEQAMWKPDLDQHGLFSYPVGKPKTSGLATINGTTIETGKEYTLGSKGKGNDPANQVKVRLSAKGTLQIFDPNNEAKNRVSIKEANSNALESYEAIVAGKWIDMQPGDKVKIGDKELAFENDVRLYKPDEWLTVADTQGLEIMQAKDLEKARVETMAWQYSGIAASVAMDIGMVLTGTAELKAAKYVGEKGLATASEKALATLAQKQAMQINGLWHLGLGGSGFIIQGIENRGNQVGHWVGAGSLGTYATYARTGAMMSDIAFNNLLGSGAKSWWGTKIGEAHPESMQAYLQTHPLLAGLQTFSTRAMVAAEVQMSADLTGHKIIPNLRDKYYRGDPNHDKNAERSMPGIHQIPPIETTVAPNLQSICNKETQKAINEKLQEVNKFKQNTLAGFSAFDKEREAEAEKLALIYADKNETPDHKIAAILGLLSLRQGTDGSLPEVLCTYKADGKTAQSLTLYDAEKALLDFKPIRLTAERSRTQLETFDDFTRELSKPGQIKNDNLRELVITKTQELLKKDADKASDYQQRKQAHLKELYSIYQSTDDNKAKSAAAISLLMLNKEANGAIPQKLFNMPGYAVSVSNKYTNDAKHWEFTADTPEAALQAAREHIRKNSEWQIEDYDLQVGERLANSELFTASEAIKFLEGELGQSKSAASRLALADTLHDLGQLSDTALGGVCQEILNDKNTTDKAKIAAMLDPKHDRLAQLFARQHFDIEETLWNSSGVAGRLKIAEENVGRDSVTMQQALLSVLRNQKDKPEVRALALKLLNIGNNGSNLKRKAEIANLTKQWHAASAVSDFIPPELTFVPTVAADLKKNISLTEKPGEPSSAAQRLTRFQAALSLYELKGISSPGLGAVDTKVALANLLSCLGIDGQSKGGGADKSGNKGAGEDKSTDTSKVAGTRPGNGAGGGPGNRPATAGRGPSIDDVRQSCYISAQILPVMRDNINFLSKDQKTELRKRVVDILGSADNLSTSVQQGEVKKIALQNLGPIFAECDKDTREALASALKNNATQKEEFVLALSKLDRGEQQADTVKFLHDLAKNQSNSVQIRAAALEGLDTIHPANLKSISLDILKDEKESALMAKLRSMERLEKKPDSNSLAYKHTKEQAKEDLQNSLRAVNLSESEKYLASHLWGLVADDFNSERRQTRSAKSVSSEQIKEALNTIVEKAKQDDGVEERNALAYIVLNNGRPFFDAHREEAVKQAAAGLYAISKDGSTKAKQDVAPLLELCLISKPLMPHEARRSLMNGLTWLDPGSKDSAVTKEEAATVLSLALEQELANMPKDAVNDSDYQESKKLQVEMIGLLSRYAGNDQIPLLLAIAGPDKPATFERDAEGFAKVVHLPDGSTVSLVRDGQTVTSLTCAVLGDTEKSEVWTREKDKDIYFSDKDPKKEKPFVGRYIIDKADNLIILTNSGTDIQSLTGKESDDELFNKGIFRLPIAQMGPNTKDTLHPMPEVREAAQKLIATLKKDDSFDIEKYEAAKAQLAQNSLRSARQINQGLISNDWFRSSNYKLLDSDTFAEHEQEEANKSLGAWWQFWRTADYGRGKETAQLHAKDQLEKLCDAAWQSSESGKEARAALAYIVLSNGRPLRDEEERTKAITAAVDTMTRICKSNGPGANDMLSIVKTLIAEPTLNTSIRRAFFDTVKELATSSSESFDELFQRVEKTVTDHYKSNKITDARTAYQYLQSQINALADSDPRKAAFIQISDSLVSACKAGTPVTVKGVTTIQVDETKLDNAIDKDGNVIPKDNAPVTTPNVAKEATNINLAKRSLQEIDAAQTVARGLEVEYRTMPAEYLQNRVERKQNPAFAASEKLQLDMLDYLKKVGYKENVPALEALVEKSPSLPVRFKAKELLRQFDRISTIDFVPHPEIKPEVKAEAISKTLSEANASEDHICQTIIANSDTPFIEEGNHVVDPRAKVLLQAMHSSNERIRVAAAQGYARCSARSYIEPPQEVLLTAYEISNQGQRSVCREEAKAILTPWIWRYKNDPSGDLWTSKVKSQLDELLKAKQAQE